MFCKNCGQQMPDGVEFCPNCGEQHTPAAVGNDMFNMTTESKTESAGVKKSVFVVIAAIAAVAVLVVGIIFGVKALSGPKYEKNNSFAQAAKDVDKDSDQYHMLNAFAAVQNLLFNSESFEFELSLFNDDYNGKIAFGKDIASSQVIFNAENEIVGSLYNGKLEGAAFGDGLEIDIANVLKGTTDFANELISNGEDSIEDMKEELKDMKDRDIDDEVIKHYEKTIEASESLLTRLKENAPAIDKAAQNLIADNKLNYDALSELYDNLVVPYVESMSASRGIEDIKMPPFGFWLETLADFLANGLQDDDLDITVTKTGKGKEAVYSYDIKINILDVAESFYKYASSKAEVKEMLGDNADDLFDEMEEEIEEAKDYVDDDEATIKVTIETKNGYVTKIKPRVDGLSFTLEITNVNDTEITEEEYKEIKDEIDDADDFYTIDDMNDIIDEVF